MDQAGKALVGRALSLASGMGHGNRCQRTDRCGKHQVTVRGRLALCEVAGCGRSPVRRADGVVAVVVVRNVCAESRKLALQSAPGRCTRDRQQHGHERRRHALHGAAVVGCAGMAGGLHDKEGCPAKCIGKQSRAPSACALASKPERVTQGVASARRKGSASIFQAQRCR